MIISATQDNASLDWQWKWTFKIFWYNKHFERPVYLFFTFFAFFFLYSLMLFSIVCWNFDLPESVIGEFIFFHLQYFNYNLEVEWQAFIKRHQWLWMCPLLNINFKTIKKLHSYIKWHTWIPLTHYKILS